MKAIAFSVVTVLVVALAVVQSYELGQKATPVVHEAAANAWESLTNEQKVAKLEKILAMYDEEMNDLVEENKILKAKLDAEIKAHAETWVELQDEIMVFEQRLAVLKAAESKLVVDLLQ